jgi:hypothetical protein
MGFLNLFKRKHKEAVSLSLEEVPAWFESQIEERVSGLDGAIQGFYSAVRQLLKQLTEQKSILLSAEIKDEDKLESRLKHIVLGHRVNYAREITLFLNEISIPEEANLDHARGLSEEIIKKLDLLSKQTHKSFQACQHLFHKEADNIFDSLRELSNTSQSFHQFLDKKGIIESYNVKLEVTELIHTQNKMKQFELELQNKRNKQLHANKQIISQETAIAALEASGDYNEYQRLLGRRDILVDSCAAAERDITSLFLELDRSLRKYEYIAVGENQALVQSYLQDPRTALLKDNTLSIIPLLFQLKKDVKTLGLKQEQEKKIINTLNELDRNQIVSLRQRYMGSKEECSIIADNIAKHPIINQIREAEYRKTHFKQQADRLEREIKLADSELAEFDLNDKCHKTAKRIEQVLGIPVIITI